MRKRDTVAERAACFPEIVPTCSSAGFLAHTRLSLGFGGLELPKTASMPLSISSLSSASEDGLDNESQCCSVILEGRSLLLLSFPHSLLSRSIVLTRLLTCPLLYV